MQAGTGHPGRMIFTLYTPADHFVQMGSGWISLKKKHGHNRACKHHPEEINLFEQGSEGCPGEKQVGPIPVDMQAKADGNRAEQADKGAEHPVDTPPEQGGGAQPGKVGSGGDQQQQGGEEHGHRGDERAEKAMEQVADKGRRDHDGAGGELAQGDAVQEGRCIEPSAGFDDLMEQEGHRGKAAAKGDEVDSGHEQGQLREVGAEEGEQGKARGSGSQQREERQGGGRQVCPGLGLLGNWLSAVQQQAEQRGKDQDEDRMRGKPEQSRSHEGHNAILPTGKGTAAKGDGGVGDNDDNDGLQATESRHHGGQCMRTGVEHRKHCHEEEGREAEAKVAYDGPAHAPKPQADVRSHLHGGGARNCLAKRHAIPKSFLVEPAFLLNRQFADMGNHGRPAEGGYSQAQEGEKQPGQ